MDIGVISGLVGIFSAIVLICIGVPIAISFLLTATFCLFFVIEMSPNVISAVMANTLYDWSSAYALTTVPLFILMGALLMESEIGSDLYDSVHKWFGRLPAGLAVSTFIACAGFAACSGSSVATAATMGKVCLPGMKRYGYAGSIAAGVVAAGGTLGILIPPSTVLIIYGVLTGESIIKLFLAGIVPGLLLLFVWVVQVMIISKIYPHLAPASQERYSLREKVSSSRTILPVALLFVLIIGGLYIGLFGPTEAAGIGAFVALLICLAMRRLGCSGLHRVVSDTILISGMNFFIIIGAMVFNCFLSVSGVANVFTTTVQGLDMPPTAIMLIILAFYVIAGMVMDTVSITVLTVPLIAPIVSGLGYDLIWFGIIFTIMIEMALITPPVGMNCFVIKSLSPDISTREIFSGAGLFVGGQIVVIAILLLFPEIALFMTRGSAS